MTETDRLLAGLETRLLVERYAGAVDRCDGPAFAALFTQDGVLEAPRGSFVGHEALSGVPAMMKKLYRRTWHGISGQVLDFDGDVAQGETYCLARHFYEAADGEPHCYEMTIRYADRFERVDGHWLIGRRALLLDAGHRFPLAKSQGT